MIEKTLTFNYPIEFKSLPSYSDHRGKSVKVVRELSESEEYDFEGDKMYEIRDESDGWIGYAFESELSKE